MNNSTTRGYLAQTDAPPAEDIDLDMLIQPAVVGITGMLDALVVIKGQEVPPDQPDRPVTWCAIGTTGIDQDQYPSEVHVGSAEGGQGISRFFLGEEIEVMASFYGPQARAMASRLAAGLKVQQNTDQLRASGLAYVRFERLTNLADLENEEYVRRCDAVFLLRRMVGRTYSIRNVERLAAEAVVDTAGPAVLADPFNTGI